MSTDSDVINTKPPETSLKLTTMEQTAGGGTSSPIIHHQVAGKHQMLPVVYIQTQSVKSVQKINTTNAGNVVLPQIQLQNITPMQSNSNQAGMLLGKSPIVLQKAGNLPKNGVTYLTMLKPVAKPPDNIRTVSRLPITTLGKMKSDSTIQMINNHQGKIVIAPMPSVTSNRLPVTATTNSVQSKFSFMPMIQSVQRNVKGSFINFKVDTRKPAETKLVDSDLTITAVTENHAKDEPTTDDKTAPIEDQSYELSIIEEPEQQVNTDASGDDNKQRMSSIQAVSILKRSFSQSETKTVHDTSTTNTTLRLSTQAPRIKRKISNKSTIITISDPQTKEVVIQTADKKNPPTPVVPLPVLVPIISTPKPPPPTTTKRSRKSTLCLRKDDHEIELESPPKKIKEEEDKKVDMEVDLINSKKTNQTEKTAAAAADFDFNMLLEEEVAAIFHWESGVGTLPGSNIRFLINEFGFLEYITQDEYQKMQNATGKTKKDKREEKAKRRSQQSMQEEMRCLECGCFGMASEFINPKYCSVDCRNNGEKKSSTSIIQAATNHANALRKRSLSNNTTPSIPAANTNSNSNVSNSSKKRKLENGANDSKEPSSDDDGSEITDVSHDKNYPWHCKKGFSWSKYLAHMNAISAPQKLFKDAFPYNRNGFRPGMKLEGIDPHHPSYFCVMTVAQVQGYRLQLHFDGYPDNYDFWVNADSMDIFPAGFCEKHDHLLHPPPNFKNFTWSSYLKFTKSTVAPKHLFTNRTGSAIFPTAFRAGMKLEAVDRKNTSLICVATARDLMDSRILVHFDSWDDIYDYWADPSSHYIHPVGWCDKNGHRLTPPSDYPDKANFTWEKYLKETNAVAAPVRAFKQRPSSGFKKGMRLECVDKRVPQLIRAVTVVDVREHRLRISFDGWPDRYSYWVDEDSPDIHPAGWCQKTGHPLEPPLTPDDVYDFLECATVGCRGVGNIKGLQFPAHTTQKYCPYADENIDLEKIHPDRLLSPDRELEAVIPISREPKAKKPGPKKKYETNSTKTEWLDDSDLKDKDFKIIKSSPVSVKKESLLDEEINHEEVKMREKHAKFFKSYVKRGSDPTDWTAKKVCDYVNSLPFMKRNADVFVKNAIDGESFLMLSQQDLIELMNFKLGPAIALYNCILLLRKNITDFT